ncbi:MAG: capsular biosynthesis protein [Erythrobacter sp.]|jgi:Mrp family chromosome partitioning ATPase|nr:capsular biosynthesis protein [Erythrobacter sp.]
MTKHSTIDPASGEPIKPGGTGRPSLLERADAAYGLDRLGPARVPAGLPKAARRPSPPARGTLEPSIFAGQAAEGELDPHGGAGPALNPENRPNPRPEPRPESRVELSGPFCQIDRDGLRAAGLIVPEDPVSGLLEEFRIVKRELLADARSRGASAARRILVCSPHTGEGKTFCAANLAIALAAERDTEVLLIDVDVLKPALTERLGLGFGKGLMDALADPSIAPETLACRTDIEGLFVMPAGSGSARDSEYLASARTGAVLDRLTQGAPDRYLVFDTPPALAASAAAELAGHCGQALLIVRAEETSRAAIEDARQLLSACPDLKLLLNATKFSPSGRRFGSYGEQEE